MQLSSGYQKLASTILFCIAVQAMFVIVGCQQRPEKLVESAKEYMAKGDYAAASIQLKNAVQKGDSGEVRFLLASSLTELGDYAAAEIQLRKAVEAQYAPALVYPQLAKVLLGLGDPKKVVADLSAVSLPDRAAQSAIKSAIGEAQLLLGQRALAHEAFSAALVSTPDDPRALVGDARVVASEGDLVSAGKVADDILVRFPSSKQALSLKADVLISQAKPAEAIQILTRLVGVAPFDGQARFVLLSLYIGLDQYDLAAAGVADMQRVLPNDIRGRYLAAVLAFRKNDPLKARDAVIQVLNAAPEHVPSLLLAGAAEYQLGALSTAIDYLRKVIAKNPNSLYARNILVACYLRQGQSGKAEEVLLPALKLAPSDPMILRAAGEVALANNQLSAAANFYSRALEVEKDNISVKTRLAQIRLANGETDRALAELETTSSQDKNQYQADFSLISAQLVRNQFDKALVAVAVLEKKQPDNPLTFNLKGAAFIGKKDFKSARVSFEKALALQFNYLPAARNLARLDAADKNSAAAIARFNAILAKEPTSEGALLALAETQIMTDTPSKEVLITVNKAISADANSVPARLALINYLSKMRDHRSALAAAQAALNTIPNDVRLLDGLGSAQLASGEINAAIETFKKLAALQPDSPLPLLRLASAQYASKQVDAPLMALRKALAMRPDLLEAQRDIVTVQLAAGKPDEALKETRAIQKLRPKEGVGFALEGDVLASQKKFTEATRAYAEAIKRQPSPELIVKQHQLLLMAGRAAEANALTTQWVRENPAEPIVRFYLANVVMQKKDYKEAAQRYREILVQQPDNVAILNNLAWVLSEMNEPSGLTYAEKAYAKAPDNPNVQNTYGWLLFNRNESPDSKQRGMTLLVRAAELAPLDADIKMHLAKAMLKTGDRQGAIKQFQELIKIADPALKAEAELLLKSL